MIQSKRGSAIESLVSTVVGYIVAVCLYMVVLPLFGHETTWSQSISLTSIFAAASIFRGYVVRRIFNRIEL